MKNMFIVIALLFINTTCFADQAIVAKRVGQPPVIDGKADDAAWALAEGIVTHDEVANIDMTLKAVYTEDMIFFLATYPDADESREHKTWIWNKETEMYDRGPEREDMFVFKWNLEEIPVDLSIYADNEYSADIWFWKAHRTDSLGYADDKIQKFNQVESPKTQKVISKSGKGMFLQRNGDGGTAAYKDTLYAEYQGDRLSHFTFNIPTGSRADVKAKGLWSGGGDVGWTIEFSRALQTGNEDDVQFSPEKTYQFGVSRYEISGRDEDPSVLQPLYGIGDTSEPLYLKFEL